MWWYCGSPRSSVFCAYTLQLQFSPLPMSSQSQIRSHESACNRFRKLTKLTYMTRLNHHESVLCRLETADDMIPQHLLPACEVPACRTHSRTHRILPINSKKWSLCTFSNNTRPSQKKSAASSSALNWACTWTERTPKCQKVYCVQLVLPPTVICPGFAALLLISLSPSHTDLLRPANVVF